MPSIKLDRRALLASAVISAFVGAASLTTVIATSQPARAAEHHDSGGGGGGGDDKAGGGDAAHQEGQKEMHKGCDKYDKNSQDYKNCMGQQ